MPDERGLLRNLICSNKIGLRTKGSTTPTPRGPARGFGVCYAMSKDGLHWEKPELGLIDFNGSKKNNIVIEYTHGVAVMKDLHETDPQNRYKAIHMAPWWNPAVEDQATDRTHRIGQTRPRDRSPCIAS